MEAKVVKDRKGFYVKMVSAEPKQPIKELMESEPIAPKKRIKPKQEKPRYESEKAAKLAFDQQTLQLGREGETGLFYPSLYLFGSLLESK